MARLAVDLTHQLLASPPCQYRFQWPVAVDSDSITHSHQQLHSRRHTIHHSACRQLIACPYDGQHSNAIVLVYYAGSARLEECLMGLTQQELKFLVRSEEQQSQTRSYKQDMQLLSTV
jgi:hypothetical protein